MEEHVTTVTRKGQITLPAKIRRALGIKQGDKVIVSLAASGSKEVTVRSAPSVADLTFGAISPRNRPEDLRELRKEFIELAAENAAGEGGSSGTGG
jgi:AbrB family looped-hinge helix DNA binding protein